MGDHCKGLFGYQGLHYQWQTAGNTKLDSQKKAIAKWFPIKEIQLIFK